MREWRPYIPSLFDGLEAGNNFDILEALALDAPLTTGGIAKAIDPEEWRKRMSVVYRRVRDLLSQDMILHYDDVMVKGNAIPRYASTSRGLMIASVASPLVGGNLFKVWGVYGKLRDYSRTGSESWERDLGWWEVASLLRAKHFSTMFVNMFVLRQIIQSVRHGFSNLDIVGFEDCFKWSIVRLPEMVYNTGNVGKEYDRFLWLSKHDPDLSRLWSEVSSANPEFAGIAGKAVQSFARTTAKYSNQLTKILKFSTRNQEP